MKLIFLILFAIFFNSCHKKDSQPVPKAVVVENPQSLDSVEGNADYSAMDSNSALSQGQDSNSEPIQKLRIVSQPSTKLVLGQLFQYRVKNSASAKMRVNIVSGPDSLKVVQETLTWIPTKTGSFPIQLNMEVDSNSGPKILNQNFVITVSKTFSLSMQPIPEQVNKGDSVLFDFRGSAFPAWALNDLKLKIDFEGDGKWDLENAPLAQNISLKKCYTIPGHYKPKVEVSFRDLQSENIEGSLAVISAVTAVLKMSPDTLEPGATLNIDASASKGDGKLVYSLDLTGDGKVDWADSLTGKTTLVAPSSGVYPATLTVKNSMGQEGKITTPLRVNAKIKLEMKIKNPKANMAEEVEVRAHVKDADDSLLRVRINYTGDTSGWQIRTTKADSVISNREWLLRFKHNYGKVGKYPITLCALSVDQREVCQKSMVEIFNAPPVCKPGADFKATVGIPMDVEGDGIDPDGKIVKWEWDLDHDGKYDLNSNKNGKFKYTFSKPGTFELVLRVTTEDGMNATGSRKVEVRN